MAISLLEKNYRDSGFSEDQIKKAVGSQYVGVPAPAAQSSFTTKYPSSGIASPAFPSIPASPGLSSPKPAIPVPPAPQMYTPPRSTSAAQSAAYVTSGQALKDSGKTQINGMIRPNGSILDTTGMTPQQAYAADINNRNPNDASKYLSSMGLDINGNPTNHANIPAPNPTITPIVQSSPTVNAPPAVQQAPVYAPGPAGQQGSAASSIPATAAPTAQATPAPQQITEDKIRAEVAARLAKQRSGLSQSVNETKTSLKNAYDYNNQIEQDTRVLQNTDFQRNNLPENFTGQTGYRKAMLERNRSIQDTASQKDYAANVAAADRRLAEFDQLAPEQQDAMYNDLMRIERDYGLNVGQLTGNFNGQRTLAGQQTDFGQMDANRKYGLESQGQTFNQGISQAGLTGVYNGKPTQQAQNQTFNQGVEQAGLTGNYDPYSSQKQKMQENSAAWFKASPEDQQRLSANNQAIGASIGAYQDANGDWQYPQAQRTLQGQNLDLNNAKDMAVLTGYMPNGQPTNAKQQQDLTNLWTAAEQTGMIPNQLADFYGLPQGMQTQSAKTAASQLAISKQNANNSSSSVNFSKLMDIWKATGKAPEGLKGYGIQPGTSFADSKDNTQIKGELDGLYSGLQSGKINAAAAIDEINQKMKVGLYSTNEGSQLLALAQQFANSNRTPIQPLTTSQIQQIDQSGGKNYQDMNTKQIEKEWETDPSGKAAGTGVYDWSAWVRDPNGRMAGVSFPSYQQAFGPSLRAK